MIKIGTLFSGGLAAVEWAMKYEKLKHEIVFACEWDKYARKQYLEFHGEPTSNFYEDVSDMNGKPYRDNIDLMVWGSPCQDLSLAGKRKGFDGEKSSLFREGARIMSEVMPKAFIFENVKGLLSSNAGADYKEVENTFRELGYHMAMKVVNAKQQGTAQNRERVFVIGFLDVNTYHDFNFADSVPLTKVLRDYLEDEVDEKYYLSEKMIAGFISSGEKHKDKGNGFAWNPKNEDDIANCLRANGALNSSDNSIKVGFINQDTHASSVFTSDGVSPSLCSGTHGYAQGYIKEPKLNQVGELDIKGSESLRRVYGLDGLCPTMTTMGGGNRQPKVLMPTVAVKSATKSGYEIATENDSINFTHPGSTTRRGRVGVGVAQTLDCACNQGVIEPKILDFTNSFGEDKVREYSDVCPTLRSERSGLCVTEGQIDIVGSLGGANESNSRIYGIDGISPTLLAGESGGGQNPVKHLTHDFRIRRLTPRECFRLMGMKDEDIALVNSDTQSYKIAGNGIEINTMRSIIKQLYMPVKLKDSLF